MIPVFEKLICGDRRRQGTEVTAAKKREGAGKSLDSKRPGLILKKVPNHTAYFSPRSALINPLGLPHPVTRS
jgi:hypothetical protein